MFHELAKLLVLSLIKTDLGKRVGQNHCVVSLKVRSSLTAKSYLPM